MAFARQRKREVAEAAAAVAFAEASRAKALSAALDTNFARGLTADIKIASLISADQARFQRVAGMTALQGMNPLLEAERERRERIAELLNPCHGALEALHMQTSGLERIAELLNPCHGALEALHGQTSGLERIAEAGTESLRRMAEACAPRIAPMEFGLGLNAIAALGSIGNLAAVAALADLHVPVRIHALPRLPTQNALCPGRSREAFPDRQPLSPIPEAPAHPEPTGWLEDSLEDEGGQRFLEQLSRFVRSEEIPSDAREGMDFLLALWKLKKTGLSKTERRRLHLTVVDFLRQQIGVLPPAGGLQQLASGLLVPHPHGKTPAPDLDPEIFTTQQLAKKLPSTTDTLKRHAKKACENGPLPQQMPAFPGWFVVAQSDPKGGQGCGWKFQQRSEP
jgi:hypothetical protein